MELSKQRAMFPLQVAGATVARPYRARSEFFLRRCPNGCSSFVVFTQGGGQASARGCETVWSTVMAKFLFIYRESTESRAQPSPEEMQALRGPMVRLDAEVQRVDPARRRRIEAEPAGS